MEHTDLSEGSVGILVVVANMLLGFGQYGLENLPTLDVEKGAVLTIKPTRLTIQFSSLPTLPHPVAPFVAGGGSKHATWFWPIWPRESTHFGCGKRRGFIYSPFLAFLGVI